MSHEPTRLMACERARGGQCIRVAVHAEPSRAPDRKCEKFFSVLGFRVAVGLTPLVDVARSRSRGVRPGDRGLADSSADVGTWAGPARSTFILGATLWAGSAAGAARVPIRLASTSAETPTRSKTNIRHSDTMLNTILGITPE